MTKTVNFEAKPLLIPERLQTPAATSILQRLHSDSLHQHNEQVRTLELLILLLNETTNDSRQKS